MLTLAPQESMIAQMEAKGRGTPTSWKFKGEGVLYITTRRIALEDRKKRWLLLKN